MLGAPLPENGNSASFQNIVLVQTIRWWTKAQNKKIVSVNFSHGLFSLLDLILEDGINRLSWNIGKELLLHAV